MYQIEVDVTRLGGAFGGKEDQATAWAVMAALGSFLLKKPVKLILDREDDMYATGKRHPYSSDFKIGLDEDYKIESFEVKYYQNGGAAADLSPAILERTLFHVTNAYHIPNVKATASSCRTNITPFTAFRGFGGPQAMFVIEAAIALAAEELGIDPTVIQERNLLRKGDEFHYGQKCASDNAVGSWNALLGQLESRSEFAKDPIVSRATEIASPDVEGESVLEKRDLEVHSFVEHGAGFIEEIETYNQHNLFRKKGWAVMPICFGISFTNTSMNQARALVHIYQDGSVSVSTGAIEMGQGVNTKLSQVAARTLGISTERIRLETTNTRRVANTSPTAASSGADLNGKATQIACQELMARLTKQASIILHAPEARVSVRDEWVYVGEKKSSLNWDQLIVNTLLSRVQLSAVGHYATPEIHFNKGIEKGHPFAYHVFGSALIQVELNALLGSYEVERVSIVHDFGNSFNMDIDLGQVEGALMQGIGWMTVEELAYAENGRLLSDSLSKYKVPDIYMAPKKVEVQALETEGEALAILRSKAVGEPPFMYGIGTYFALAKAIKAFNPRYKYRFDAPMTPEKVLMGLYS
jgi:xanthine dehydrogenase large subunit